VVVEFHEHVTIDSQGSNKTFAAYCKAKSGEGVNRVLMDSFPPKKARTTLAPTAPEVMAGAGKTSTENTPQSDHTPVE